MSSLKSDIVIDWIRHGYSCGNAKVLNGKNIFKKWRGQVLNPALTDLGLLQAKEYRKALNGKGQTLSQRYADYDIVCSSDMLRAMETAVNIFGRNRTMTVLPYVQEIPQLKMLEDLRIDKENIPETPAESVRRMEEMGNNMDRLDYDLYNDVSKGKYKRPSFRKFLREIVLGRWLSTESPFYRKPAGRPLKVAIVTHGHFMVLFTKVSSIISGSQLLPGQNCATVSRRALFQQQRHHKLLSQYCPHQEILTGQE